MIHTGAIDHENYRTTAALATTRRGAATHLYRYANSPQKAHIYPVVAMAATYRMTAPADGSITRAY